MFVQHFEFFQRLYRQNSVPDISKKKLPLRLELLTAVNIRIFFN